MFQTPAFLRCPRTGSPLSLKDTDTLVAAEGGWEYPVVFGFPDLRLSDPPYVSRAEERERVARLEAAAPSLTFDALVAFYETEINPHISQERRRKAMAHRLSLPQRASERVLRMMDAAGVQPAEAGPMILDLGCGSGEAVGALAGLSGGRVVGLDISLEELVFARKLLAGQGVAADLIAGNAEALPFADDTFSLVYSPDVIEHVTDQRAYLAAAARVLAPGGRLLLNSPNRYSLVAPEPHVGIWALGFVPRSWMDPVSRRLGGGPYTGKRLVSLPEFRRLLGEAFPEVTVRVRQSNPAATSLPGRLFHWFRPVSVPLFALVDHEHVAVARKTLAGPGAATRRAA